MKVKNIIFTGGGSGGHVIPAITIIKKVKDLGINTFFVGSYRGIESQITPSHVEQYFPISTGKLRRYMSIENFKDIFRLLKGFWDAFMILNKFSSKTTIVFSTGGFVSVPVAIMARILFFKVYIHEQTTRVGLANKLCSYFATNVFVSFEDSLPFFPKNKTIYSGYPLRKECLDSYIYTKSYMGIELFNSTKPIIFITGGGNGSHLLNEVIFKNLSTLKKLYFVIHQTGSSLEGKYKNYQDKDYVVVDFVKDEIIDLFKSASCVISRAGAGTVCELISLDRASIYIPLKIAQKNEQFHNAMAAKKKVGSIVIEEDNLAGFDILKSIDEVVRINRSKQSSHPVITNPTDLIVDKILNS